MVEGCVSFKCFICVLSAEVMAKEENATHGTSAKERIAVVLFCCFYDNASKQMNPLNIQWRLKNGI